MIRSFPFLDDSQIPTSFDFREQTMNESGELPTSQIAVVGPPSLQLTEIMSNWSNTGNEQNEWQGPEFPSYSRWTNKWVTQTSSKFSPKSYPTKSKTGNDTEVFLFCTRETRNELGMPLQHPSLHWWGLYYERYQKFPSSYAITMHNLERNPNATRTSYILKNCFKNRVKRGRLRIALGSANFRLKKSNQEWHNGFPRKF